MATDAEIRTVKEKLGPDAVERGYTDTRISEDIDLGLSPNQIALNFWEASAAATSRLVDVSESGSSRALSGVHRNATAMAERYQKLIQLADKTDGVEDPRPTRGPGIRTFPIRRTAR